jgi:hypothetical protein
MILIRPITEKYSGTRKLDHWVKNDLVLLQPEMERRPTRVILQLGRSLTMRKPRKNYTPVEKVAILRRHLIDHVPVSDLCTALPENPVFRAGFSGSRCQLFDRCLSGCQDCSDLRLT